MPTRGLPRGAGHLPAAERLDADDRARCGAGRPVRIQDAGMDFREEPPNLRRFAAEDSRGEAIVHVVRDSNRVPEVIHRDNRQDRHEELFLVDSVVPRQAVHDCRLHEMPVSLQRSPAGDDRSLRALDFRNCVLEGRDRRFVDDGPEIHVANGRVRVNVWRPFIPTSLDPGRTNPSTSGWSRSSCPTVAPGPVTKLNTPAGSPASLRVSARPRPMNGVSLAGLKTTVLPVISAPVDIPAAIARGKLNGATTAQTAYGFRIERVVSPGRNVPIGRSYPSLRNISAAYQRIRSAASSTSALAS